MKKQATLKLFFKANRLNLSFLLLLIFTSNISAQTNACFSGAVAGCDWNPTTKVCYDRGFQPTFDNCGVCGGDSSTCSGVNIQTFSCGNQNNTAILNAPYNAQTEQKKFIQSYLNRVFRARKISRERYLNFTNRNNVIFNSSSFLLQSVLATSKSCSNGSSCFLNDVTADYQKLSRYTRSSESLAASVARFLSKRSSIQLVKNVASWSSALTNTLPKIRACTANGIFVTTPTPIATVTPIKTATTTPTATIAPTTVPVTNAKPKITGIQSLDASVNPPQYINNFGYSGQYIVLYGDFKESGNTLLSNFDASITYQSKKQINVKLNSLVQTGIAYFIITNEFGNSDRVDFPILKK